MNRRIFLGIFAVAVAVFLACMVLIVGVDYNYYLRDYENKIKQETSYIAEGVELDGQTYLDRLEKGGALRVTWIASDGKVLFDNEADAATMENHANREEVRQALSTGTGASIRYSDTLKEKMLYYALRLDDGTVLRTAMAQKTLLTILPGLIEPLILVLVIAVILSLLLAFRTSRSIVKPINALNFDAPEKSHLYRELHPLVERITQQNVIIAAQMEELRVEHEAREKMRREFTANVSHELKTPLTSISGFAEILRHGMVKNEDVEKFSGYIYDEAQRLISLVGDIIKLSQLDDNELPVKKVRIDLYDACTAVLASLKPAAESRRVTVALSGEHAAIFGAEQIVDEIIHNLVDNAIKYNNEGGSVTVSVTRKGSEIELAVADTGIGIPASDQPRVFERFYRVNKSHSKELGGTGLGLSIVKHGASFHSARIVLESAEGKGTTIRIFFKAE